MYIVSIICVWLVFSYFILVIQIKRYSGNYVCFFSNQTQLVLLPLSCQYLISQPYQMHFLMVKGMLASYCHRDDEVIKVVI